MSALPRRWVVLLPAAALLLALLPGGCGGLLPKPPERQLYRLDPDFAFAAGLPSVPAQLLVATPNAPAGLDTERIALSRSPLSFDYFADAEWTDRVPFLVRAALVDGFERSHAIAGVGPASLGLHADFVLETTIRDFTAIYDEPKGPPRVVVAFDADLVRLPERHLVAHASLEGATHAASDTLPAIVRAFNQALGRAVHDEVLWVIGTPALSRRPESVR